MTVEDKGPQDINVGATAAAAAATAAASEADVAQALREHADVVSRGQSARPRERREALSPEAMQDLLHELQVHQIELEMQNEELRRAQVELDASRARYFNLYDLAPVGYCSVSEPGLILQANLAAATLLGATRGTLIRQPVSRFIFKADQDTWYLHRKLLTETGQAQSLELRLARQDGALVWVHVATSAVNDASGPASMLVVLSDVTDRKLMEAAMRESEGRYRAIVESSPEAIVVHLGGKVIYASPVAVKILGATTANELAGKPFLDLIHPAFHQTVLAGLKNVSDQRDGSPLAELRCLRLDGTVVEVEARSNSTSYDGNQVTITSLRVSHRTDGEPTAQPC